MMVAGGGFLSSGEPRLGGVILAGGAASRMGGGDKGLREVAGRSLLARAIERLSAQLDGPIALSANGDPARFAAFNLPVIGDAAFAARGERLGPLAGVLAALDWARAEGLDAVVSAAADTPFFPTDLAARLIAAAQTEAAPIALAASRGAETGRSFTHPTFGLWSTALADDLRAALEVQGVRKILAWTDRHGAAIARFEPAAVEGASVDRFFNVNTPEDLAAAEKLASLAGW